MDRRVWWATVHAVTKELDLTWELDNNKGTTLGTSNIAVKKEIKYGPYKLGISQGVGMMQVALEFVTTHYYLEQGLSTKVVDPSWFICTG